MSISFRKLALLGALIGAAQNLSASEDWNFTPQDYAALRAQGEDLRLSAALRWLHPRFAESLLKGIRFALAEEDGVVRTEGVKFDDFYHGHIVCYGIENQALEKIVRPYTRSFERARDQILGNEHYINDRNLGQFKTVVRHYESEFQSMLNKSLESGLCDRYAVMLHTFEENKPEDLDYGDPRRNILVPIGGEPQGYTPPYKGYLEEFTHIEQIPFLITHKGEVLATVGVDSHIFTVLDRVLPRHYKK